MKEGRVHLALGMGAPVSLGYTPLAFEHSALACEQSSFDLLIDTQQRKPVIHYEWDTASPPFYDLRFHLKTKDMLNTALKWLSKVKSG